MPRQKTKDINNDEQALDNKSVRQLPREITAKANEKDKERVKAWKEFSMTPQTEEAIKKKLLTDPNSVCVSFICRYSKLSQKFIDDLFVLTTGLVSEETYEMDYDTIRKVILNKYLPKKQREKFGHVMLHKVAVVNGIKQIIEYPVNSESINDRVDFVYLVNHQQLSEEFLHYFLNQLNISMVMHRQKLTPAFRQELYELYKKRNKTKKDKKSTESKILKEIEESASMSELDDFDDDFDDDFA